MYSINLSEVSGEITITPAVHPDRGRGCGRGATVFTVVGGGGSEGMGGNLHICDPPPPNDA